MSDGGLALAWLAFLAAGLATVRLLHRAGLPATHARDLVHVGAGSWVLGWPLWSGPGWPLGIVGAALVGTALVPLLARRFAPARALLETLASGGDAGADGGAGPASAETWTGIVLYTLSSAAFTTLGLLTAPDGTLPAAAALLALALGDGLGGAVGLRFGRHRFRIPGAKAKSLEGTVGVLLFAALGIAGAGLWFDAPLPASTVFAGAAAAALAEAASPRSTDNLLVPTAAWATLTVLS